MIADSLKKFFSNNEIEYVLCDSNLAINAFSTNIEKFAADQKSFNTKQDVRDFFPELYGSENEIKQICNHVKKNWELRGVCRIQRDTNAIYMDIKATQSDAGCLILFFDVTHRMLLEQKLIQKTNEVALLKSENQRTKKLLHQKMGFFGEMIGDNPAMQEIFAIIKRVANNNSNILIIGETGTGKELVARNIYEGGEDALAPFVAINCGAFAESLLENQLFGHVRGAFTGAVSDYEGAFRSAKSGTLFLDEIGEIPKHLQVKFLRAIQEREVTPLGSSKTFKVKARIIAATNRDLEKDVKNGFFRSDLYYRLNVVNIKIPPLRHRLEDLPTLVKFFVKQYSEIYGQIEKNVSENAMDKMISYHWPGNIRELQNVVERVYALSESSSIDVDDLPLPLISKSNADDSPLETNLQNVPATLEDQEKMMILKALQECNGEKVAAAKRLKISRNRLYRKMAKYGIPT